MSVPKLVKSEGVEVYRTGEFAAVIRLAEDSSVFARVYGKSVNEAMRNQNLLLDAYLAHKDKPESWYAPFVKAWRVLMFELNKGKTT